ncbi:hypothetical protein LCGC14_3131720, partial [marine sediment metagenome]
MGESTNIPYCHHTFSPWKSCTKVSPGCDNCYAESMAKRMWGGRAFADIRVHPERLDQVRKFKPIEEADGSLRPRLVFVNSMSDIFHEEVPDAFRDQVFDAIEDTPLTVFQCLTKRAHVMRKYIGARFKGRSVPDNIWLGPSVEDNRVKGRLRITRALKDDVGDFTAFASVEPIIDPTGSAGATLSGDASVLPKYIALQTVTAGSSVTLDDTIACVDINDVELLMRLYHTTAGSSEQQDAEFLQPYEWGIYEPDASSAGYYPVIDIANQDGTNGA